MEINPELEIISRTFTEFKNTAWMGKTFVLQS
jgi:hypothetical protein